MDMLRRLISRRIIIIIIIIIIIFFFYYYYYYSADYAVARCFLLSVCLSVCPSHAGILSKEIRNS